MTQIGITTAKRIVVNTPDRERRAFEPSECFELLDLALWTTSLHRNIEYQVALHEGKCAVQSRRSVRADKLTVQLEKASPEMEMLRVYVTLGLRVVVPSDSDADVKEVIHALEATFAAEYAIKKEPSERDFERFVNFNAVHNIWPFWRQHVFDIFRRASLPVPRVPFFPGDRKVAKAKKAPRAVAAKKT